MAIKFYVTKKRVKKYTEKIKSKFDISYTQLLHQVKGVIKILEENPDADPEEKKGQLRLFRAVEKHVTVKAIIEHLP